MLIVIVVNSVMQNAYAEICYAECGILLCSVIMLNFVVLSNVMQCDMLRLVILHVYRRSVVILSVKAPSKCLNKELIEQVGIPVF